MDAIIFANGLLDELDWLRPLVKRPAALIAADGGARHILRLNRMPDVVIGDMDSLDSETVKILRAKGVPMEVYPANKDETDLELALLYASERYKGDIYIVAALGGRLDQTLGNIMLLALEQLIGRRVEIKEPDQRIWLIRDESVIEGVVGSTVSLIPIAGTAEIQSTSGLRWPLRNEILDVGPSRGISNVMTKDKAKIVIESGLLLCVHSQFDETSVNGVSSQRDSESSSIT